MKSKKILATILTLVLAAGIFGNIRISAKGNILEKPVFSLKRINNGTGVKIVIEKTKGAEQYMIHMTNRQNSYSKYLTDGGNYSKYIDSIYKDGTKRRSYTISGLPKGTYTFCVEALTYEPQNNSKGIYETSEDGGYSIKSEERSIKIKAASVKASKEKTYDFSKVKAGDTIGFGAYEQDGIMTNGKEDIEWIVLSKTGDKLLVVSKYALDTLPYDNKDSETTWDKCSLRTYLNKDFLKAAFTKSEQKMIKAAKITTAKDAKYGTDGGKNTKDKIFLLSHEDLVNTKYGFDKDEEAYDKNRCCEATQFAINCNAIVQYDINDFSNSCWWWLRTMWFNATFADVVFPSGSVYGGQPVGSRDINVRPAMYISIN